MREQILSSLETFLEGVRRSGGETELTFEAPLPKKEQRSLDAKLPPGAAELFCTISRRIELSWRLSDEVYEKLPKQFVNCYGGNLELYPERFDCVDDDWSTGDDPVWQGKTVFAEDGSGDYFGIHTSEKPNSEIVFLSHDLDARIHGMRLASNLCDLLVRWSKIGCVGPDGVALLPFMSQRDKCLDPDGDNAKRFLEFIAASPLR